MDANLKHTPAYFHMCDFACMNEADELKQWQTEEEGPLHQEFCIQ